MTTDQIRPAELRRGRWSAQTWFNVVLLAMAVLLAASAVVGAVVLQNAAQASNRLIDEISVGRIQSERLQTALVNQETGLRGFVISGKEEFLQPYEEGRRDQGVALSQTRLVAPAAGAMDELAAVERLSAQWRARYAEPMIASVRASGPETVSSEQAEESKRAFDTVRGALTDQSAAWERARDAARIGLDDARTLRDMTFFAILVAFLVTIVAVAVLLRIAVFNPWHAWVRPRAGSPAVTSSTTSTPAGPPTSPRWPVTWRRCASGSSANWRRPAPPGSRSPCRRRS